MTDLTFVKLVPNVHLPDDAQVDEFMVMARHA